MEGWIKLYRQSQDNVLYFLEPFTKRQAWQDLLLTTAFKDWHIIVRWNIIEVKKWQNWYSENTLAERWKRSRNKVRRYLNYLETIQQIEQHKSKVKSIITITNRDKYQWNDTTDDTTERHQTDTIKKYNKVKEKNIEGQISLKEFEVMRNKIKKPLTDRAKQMIINKLNKLSTDDTEKKLILEQSILHCWQDIYPLKDEYKLDKPEIFAKYMKEWKSDKLKETLWIEKFMELKNIYLLNIK